MRTPDGYLNLTEAAAAMGVHLQTVRRLVREGKLETHTVGANRSVKLVRAADVALLREPVPVTPTVAESAPHPWIAGLLLQSDGVVLDDE